MHLTESEFKQGGEVRPLYTYQIPSPLAPFRSLILRVGGMIQILFESKAIRLLLKINEK